MIRHLYRLWPQPTMLLRLGALSAVMAVLQGLLLGLLIPILNSLLRTEPDFDAAAPWLVCGAIGAVVFAILAAVSSPLGFATSIGLTADLRRRLMQHVATLPLGWFTKDRKSRLARAVSSDSAGIATLAVTIGQPAITSILVPATIACVTIAVDWRMGLLFLVLAPCAIVTLRRAAQIAADVEVELDEASTDIAGRAIELGQAQSVLRAAGLAQSGSARLRSALETHRTVYRTGLHRSVLPDLAYIAVVMAGFIAVLILGSVLLLNNSVSVAETVALLVLAVRFLEPLGALIELVGALRAMDNAITRVEDILQTPALPAAAAPVSSLPHNGITFTGVTYAYDEAPGSPPAVDIATFSCPAGSTTALVGPSGSGKTTITRLIARFFDVTAGSVRVGDVDVRDYDHPTLLNHIAIVFQDVYLFDDTISANVLLAKPDADPAELAEAAQRARLDEVINRLPDGWNTRVGEGGAQLSGGERQRVSIARAFLKQAPIVLIDEAASALDPENEAAVSAAIAELAAERSRTVVVIAHSPATLRAVDNVVVLHEGRVAENGTPTELRAAGGLFARIHDQQSQARTWHITS